MIFAQWLAIGVLIFLGLTFLKIEHHTRKIKIIAIIAIAALIYFSITGILGPKDVDMTSPRGIVNSVYLYVGWIGSTASSLWDIGIETTHMVGNAIKINSTEEDKS